MRISKVFLDLDGVMVDCWKGFLDLHRVDKDPFSSSDIRGKAVRWSSALGITQKELLSRTNFDFWKNLEPTPFGSKILDLLESEFGKENICILTATVDARGCCDGKAEWIKNHLPAYRNQFLIGNNKGFCGGPGKLLVDDSLSNCLKFKKAGGEFVLVPAPWNPKVHLDPVGVVDRFLERYRCHQKPLDEEDDPYCRKKDS